MTKEQIEAVLERVQSWPRARQEDAVSLLLAMEEQDTTPFILSEEDEADIEAALEDIEQGRFASEEEVEAIFSQYRR